MLRVQIAVALDGGHHVEFAPHRADLGAAIDHVEGLDDAGAGHLGLGVVALDLGGAADVHQRALGVVALDGADGLEDGELVADRHLVIVVELDVDIVVLAEHQPVGGAAHDLAPDVVLAVVDPALIPEEDGARWHGASAAEADLEGRGGHVPLAQAHPIAGVDPVRVLDLDVVGPEPGPLVRVVVVVARDLPERLAAANRVAVGRVGALAEELAVAPPVDGGRAAAAAAAAELEAVVGVRRVARAARAGREVGVGIEARRGEVARVARRGRGRGRRHRDDGDAGAGRRPFVAAGGGGRARRRRSLGAGGRGRGGAGGEGAELEEAEERDRGLESHGLVPGVRRGDHALLRRRAGAEALVGEGRAGRGAVADHADHRPRRIVVGVAVPFARGEAHPVELGAIVGGVSPGLAGARRREGGGRLRPGDVPHAKASAAAAPLPEARSTSSASSRSEMAD